MPAAYWARVASTSCGVQPLPRQSFATLQVIHVFYPAESFAEATLAVAQDYVPGEGDGWELVLEALRSGQLAGAALDVFAQEPLPPESPLWDMPNVLVSPHSASTADSENAKLTDLFCENLRRYLAGQPLMNVYDRERGY